MYWRLASPRDRTVRVAFSLWYRWRSADWWWHQCQSSSNGRTISHRGFAAGSLCGRTAIYENPLPAVSTFLIYISIGRMHVWYRRLLAWRLSRWCRQTRCMERMAEEATLIHLSMSSRLLPDDDWMEPRYRNSATPSIILPSTVTLLAHTAAQKAAYKMLVLYILFFTIFVRPINYPSIYQTDFHRICRDGKTMAVDGKILS